jgi:hypothetical protein
MKSVIAPLLAVFAIFGLSACGTPLITINLGPGRSAPIYNHGPTPRPMVAQAPPPRYYGGGAPQPQGRPYYGQPQGQGQVVPQGQPQVIRTNGSTLGYDPNHAYGGGGAVVRGAKARQDHYYGQGPKAQVPPGSF